MVVADSFNKRFGPSTNEMPRCLLPLVNVPLIEYTLECLASNNVMQIFIVCCAHAEKIKQYIAASKWAKGPIEVEVIISEHHRSVGDVLREMDEKQLLVADFILVQGDLVSNAKLTKALEEHKTRREKDKNAIMTLVLKQASPSHPTRFSS